MSVKKIEEGYRAIYNTTIPYCEFGFSSMEKLLESFPDHFKFSIADGKLIIRTHVNSNITALISKDKILKKPKTSLSSAQSNSLFKKHKRKEMFIEPQLPIITMQNIVELLNKNKTPIRKDDFISRFEERCGYELKFLDYGFLNLDNLLHHLDGKVLICQKNSIYPMSEQTKTISDYMQKILLSNSGFTISTIQEYIGNISQERISDMMKSEGFVNFIDVIYDASAKKQLSYDFDLIYPHTNRVALKTPIYPPGVNEIKFLKINTPNDFFFQIATNADELSVDLIDQQMQQCSSEMKLLSMFKEHKLCAVEYDGFWYRARILSLCCQKNYESLTLRFIDHCIEVETGIQISLPTDRLRFLPPQLEAIPAFVHRGSLAYAKPTGGGYKWHKEACERFAEFVGDETWVYQAFVVGHEDGTVCIDVTALTADGERLSAFHELGREDGFMVELKAGGVRAGR